MTKRNQTTIYSICGTCARCAAEDLIKKYKLRKIELRDFPKGAPMHDEAGTPASYAVAFTAAQAREFDELNARYRA